MIVTTGLVNNFGSASPKWQGQDASRKPLLLSLVQVALPFLSLSLLFLTSGHIIQEMCSFWFLPEKLLLIILWLNKCMEVSSKPILLEIIQQLLTMTRRGSFLFRVP